LALAAPHEGSPDGANIIVRWPASANTLFSAITSIAGYEGHAAEPVEQVQTESAIDIKAFNDLEKSLGFKTLVDILQSYLQTAEGLATSLGAASEREDWGQAARLAQDFAGAAGGLGLGALTAAARSLAQNARDGAEHHVLAAATSGIIDEHTRVRDALRRLYPELCV